MDKSEHIHCIFFNFKEDAVITNTQAPEASVRILNDRLDCVSIWGRIFFKAFEILQKLILPVGR